MVNLNDNRDNVNDNDYHGHFHIDGIMSKIYCRFNVMENNWINAVFEMLAAIILSDSH